AGARRDPRLLPDAPRRLIGATGLEHPSKLLDLAADGGRLGAQPVVRRLRDVLLRIVGVELVLERRETVSCLLELRLGDLAGPRAARLAGLLAGLRYRVPDTGLEAPEIGCPVEVRDERIEETKNRLERRRLRTLAAERRRGGRGSVRRAGRDRGRRRAAAR